MEPELFNDLVQSLKEAKAIAGGENGGMLFKLDPIPNQTYEQESVPPFKPEERFRLACTMLRSAGKLEQGKEIDFLPGQKRGESPIDWLVRLGLAPNPRTAAEMLILANGLQFVLDELTGSKFEWKEPT